MPEGVKAYKGQPVLRLLPAGWPTLRTWQAAGRELRAQEQMLEVAALVGLEEALAGMALEVFEQRADQI
jgi:hypothetical protein